MFLDQARIRLTSGRGGDGHISFRREKYVPDGGPDGGNGGDGGDVIFEVDKGMNTLFDYKHRYQFKAGDGQEGGKRRCHGKRGADLVLKVPEGTILRDEKSGRIIADMSGPNTRKVILKGGRGGKGNMNYATPTMQAPRYAQPGQDGMTVDVKLELKLVADVGLVGLPNAGKSTFLRAVTNASPKVADYPFTTIEPNLGVVALDDQTFVIADMPGLIRGAAEGAGLGHEFLRHIERTRVLIHMVDGASSDGRDPVEDIRTINSEIEKYNPDILKKPMIIAVNKTDALSGRTDDPVGRVKETFRDSGWPVYPISAVTGEGVRELLHAVLHLLQTVAKEPVIYESEFDPEIELVGQDLPYTITTEKDRKGGTVYVVEGPKIEKMLGYTNLDSEKGFAFFQKFFRESGIEDELKKAGIRDKDTVRLYGHHFDYYSEDTFWEDELEDQDLSTEDDSD